MTDQPLKEWIDAALEVCQSGRELARRMGVPEHHPHEWQTGKRAMSAEAAAMLAGVLGLEGDDARRLVCAAIVANPKNKDRAHALRRVLFTCGLAGVVLGPLSQIDAPRTVQIDRWFIGAWLGLALMARNAAQALLRGHTRHAPRPAGIAAAG